MTDRPTCLLIIPTTFYGFAKTIAAALEAAGYAVTVANDEYPSNSFGKLLGKLDLPIIRFLTRRAIERKFLTGARWNLTVIFKGRGVGAALATALRRHSDRTVGYHFDSLAYDRASRHWGAHVDRVSTFDYHDAMVEDWPVVELFSTLPMPSSPPVRRYRVSAIVRSHSQRLAYVDQVIAAVGTNDIFVFFYEKDWLAWFVRALRHPRLYWRWRHHISFTPLPYDRYIEGIAASDFTIDYAHPKQTGATIRCFEARAVGTRIITNNPFVLKSDRFGPDRAIVFQPGEDRSLLRAAMAQLLIQMRPAPASRTPAEFMAEVIGTAGQAPSTPSN